MKIVIIAIILLLVCVVLMGIKVLFIKGASFPSGHVGSVSYTHLTLPTT